MKSSPTRFFDFRLLAVCALLLLCAPASGVTMDWVTVGNTGNAGQAAGDPVTIWGSAVLGAVNYEYRIGKYEVTNAQYAEFLNAVDPSGSNSLELYSNQMTFNTSGGINFNSGAGAGSKYEVKAGRAMNPVIFVDYFDAVRFTNWTNNGGGNATTEDGAYTLQGNTAIPSNASTISRNSGADVFLPSENEWYKAAYHKNDGNTANYWLYATKSDVAPYSDNPLSINTPNPSNTGNVYGLDIDFGNQYNDGFAVSGFDIYPDFTNALTDVGAYGLAVGPYGTFNQGDNVKEWNETLSIVSPGTAWASLAGGNWANGASSLNATIRFFGPQYDPPTAFAVYNNVGFRLGAYADVIDPGPGGGSSGIPEPSTLLLSALGAISLLRRHRKVRLAV
jgi:formylglycine-generating enzyme